jgi:magnesium transporter
MIRSIFFAPQKSPEYLTTIEEINEKISDTNGYLWVSIESASNEELQQFLIDTFHFHPLAVEDCQTNGYQASKVDDFVDYLFIITHALKAEKEPLEIVTAELNIFLGENYIVSVCTNQALSPVDRAWARAKRDFRITNFGPDFLCHSLLDALVDEYLPLIDEMESEVEWLEDSVLEKPTPTTLEKLLSLKHNIMSLRRIISPMREVMNRLSRDEFPQIDAQSRYYFRDIYDHLVRIQDLADTLRDIVSGALDIYLNSTSLRLNEIMKALTIVSTIFLPLSFISGVFGMNFLHIPGSTHPWGFYLACSLMILLGVGMVLYFKKRNWF